jgi:hypothetical protein
MKPVAFNQRSHGILKHGIGQWHIARLHPNSIAPVPQVTIHVR